MGLRAVRATAPVRVADVGGWTDTWFGSPGQVCSVAMGPGVAVDARLVDPADLPAGSAGPSVRVRAPAIGLDTTVGPDRDGTWGVGRSGGDALLAHAVAAVVAEAALGARAGIDVHITSAVPPGASLGTSAAVVVALIGALDALVCGGGRSAMDVARLAHEVETGPAGREAGVQDQWAAAVGGALRLAVAPYPTVRCDPIVLTPQTTAELDRRLVTVVFGPHDSSAVHREVIDGVISCGGIEHDRVRRALGSLARLAGEAADALGAGDLDRWGSVLSASTVAQRTLHPGLVGPCHQAAIDLVERSGAVGWKVNGAGGDGGSLTVLAGSSPGAATAASLRNALEGHDAAWQVLDLEVAGGLRVAPTVELA